LLQVLHKSFATFAIIQKRGCLIPVDGDFTKVYFLESCGLFQGHLKIGPSQEHVLFDDMHQCWKLISDLLEELRPTDNNFRLLQV
jgi:hypothetical protein